MKKTLVAAVLIAGVAFVARADLPSDTAARFDLETGLSGADYWAGIKRHPAVVNPVGRAADPTVISLRGEWAFHATRHGSGKRTTSFKNKDAWPDEKKVMVPGCWEASGIGTEVKRSTPFLCGDNSPKHLRHHFAGEGYYRKRVRLPAEWKGRRIWLKVGGVSSVGWFFVNDHAVAMVDVCAGQFKYEITPFVTPGEDAKVVAVVDNVVGARSGLGYVNRWGGLVRDVEIEATPESLIDEAWVRGDFDTRAAEVHVGVEFPAGETKPAEGLTLRVEIEGKVAERTVRGRENVIRMPLDDFRPWSPEHPSLYWAEIRLMQKGRTLMTRRERFGVKKLEVRDSALYLNDKPFFLRGCGDNQQYPITGTSPADREYHLAHLRKMRAAGFNFVRHHTHMERPEYFEAADEVGVMIQPELAYYLDNADDNFSYDPARDAVNRYYAFRRYPSYSVSSGGNEGEVGPRADFLLYDFLKKLDPDRLVVNQDGGHEQACDYRHGPLTVWQRGAFRPQKPFVCHEYLNLTVKSDPRAEGSYTGLFFPVETRAGRDEWLKAFGLGRETGDLLLDSQNSLQAFWIKVGLESARADPYCDGYIYWTITDSTVFISNAKCHSAQGMFNALWETKRCGTRPEDIVRSNGPTCVLLNESVPTAEMKPGPVDSFDPWAGGKWWSATNRVFASGEHLRAEILLSHFGDAPLRNARLSWSLQPTGLSPIGGEKDLGEQALGPARLLLPLDVTVPEITKAVAAKLTVRVMAEGDVDIENSWDFWLFPKSSRADVLARAKTLGVTVAAAGSDEAKAALAAGGSVVTLANQATPANFKLGWWEIGKMCGFATREHPALAGLPCGRLISPMWFRILKEGIPLPVADVAEKDVLVVGEGKKECYLYLAERRHANGAREMAVSGLDLTSDLPESNALLSGLVEYLANAKGSRVKVACIGDSITYGVGLENRGDAYPAQLQRLLDAEAPGRYEVRNFGAGGRGVYTHVLCGGTSRGYSSRAEHRAALAWKPDLVICNLGANDWEDIGKETAGGIPSGTYVAKYRELLESYRALDSRPKVAIWTRLAPITKAHRCFGSPALERVDEANAEVADGMKVATLDLYTPLADRADELMQKDGIHPTSEGSLRIAQAVLPFVLGK